MTFNKKKFIENVSISQGKEKMKQVEIEELFGFTNIFWRYTKTRNINFEVAKKYKELTGLDYLDLFE